MSDQWSMNKIKENDWKDCNQSLVSENLKDSEHQNNQKESNQAIRVTKKNHHLIHHSKGGRHRQ